MLPEQTETILQIPEEERRKIIRLMKRIPHGNFISGLIDASTGKPRRPEEAAADMSAILNILPERRWRERLVATITLRYVPMEKDSETTVVTALGKALHNNYAPKPAIAARRAALAAGRAVLCFFLAALCLFLGFVLAASVHGYELMYLVFLTPGLCLLTTSPFVFFFSPLYDSARNQTVQIAAAETLARLQIPESVGALAKATRARKRFSIKARNALIQILPTLTAAHYGCLPNDATPELCALLHYMWPNERYALELLAAIGRAGDGRALRDVSEWAEHGPTPKLREMAESILPILTARREQENASSTLLRHSSAPPVDAGQLLRAASASAATPPEQLLRPSSGIQMSAEDAEKKTKKER